MFFLEGLNVYQPLQGIPTYLVVNERFLGRGEWGEVEVLEQPERENIIDLDLKKKRKKLLRYDVLILFNIVAVIMVIKKKIFEYL